MNGKGDAKIPVRGGCISRPEVLAELSPGDMAEKLESRAGRRQDASGITIPGFRPDSISNVGSDVIQDMRLEQREGFDVTQILAGQRFIFQGSPHSLPRILCRLEYLAV